MDLNELKKYFINTEFFYYNNYLGVVKNIEYSKLSNCYVLYFHANSPKIVTASYMLERYIAKLKQIRMLILKDKKIHRLVHFTSLSNLESILENGLLSRDILDILSYDYVYSDPIRLDNKRDYISNSISFPNYKMFYSKMMENPKKDWAVLSIDSDILVDKLDTEFYRTNCASSSSLKCRYNPTSNDALEDMFYVSDRDPQIPSNFTTDPQAEVMIKDRIDPSYINCIDTQIFNSDAYYLANNFHVGYNDGPDLFTYRKDYKRW